MFFHAAILYLVKAIYLPVPSGNEIRNKELGIRKLKQFYFTSLFQYFLEILPLIDWLLYKLTALFRTEVLAF